MASMSRAHQFLSRAAAARDLALTRGDSTARARKRFLAQAPPASQRGWPQLLAFGAAGAALGAAVVLLASPRAIDFEAIEVFPSGGPGGFQTSEAEGILRFSDGSSVRLASRARASIGGLSPAGARIRIENGELSASIRHRVDSAWRFDAGEFVIVITGTRFDAGWTPETQTLRLRVTEGSVQVQGCTIQGISVSAGGSMEVRCRNEMAEFVMGGPAGGPSADSTAATATAAGSATAARPSLAVSTPSVPRVATDADSKLDPNEPDGGAAEPAAQLGWRQLAASKRYSDAFRAAEAAGFAASCEKADASELYLLSDCALQAGRPDRAVAALSQLRHRYSGSPQAATAAFQLGRIAFDRRGSLSEARLWFRTYLQEQPGGALAREALGRLMEAESRSGNSEAATQLAEQYLQAYPSGPHADLARTLCEP